jgi:ArsR family transcriptional regulator
LLAIGEGEACVCHLESVLGQRQAYISQQLMALREADVLTTRQEGRYVFYRLKDQRLLEIIALVGRMLGYSQAEYKARNKKLSQCDCPHCTGAIECC